MKVTFVIPDLFVQGAQYATAMMSNGFARKGYEVEILLFTILLMGFISEMIFAK